MAQTADFTIADVLQWARTKPAEQGFTYLDTGNCALCQFLRETGRVANPTVYGDDYSDGRAVAHPIPEAIADALVEAEETFGGLVVCLENLRPETPVNASNWQAIDAYLTDIEDVARERVSA